MGGRDHLGISGRLGPESAVRHRTRIKNEVHSALHAHLIPPCPHADLFGRRGRDWLARQPLPDDERAAIARHVRELDRLAEDLQLDASENLSC
jgi:transposase